MDYSRTALGDSDFRCNRTLCVDKRKGFMEEGMSEPVKLTVTELKDIQPIGDKGAKKLAFKAKGEDGKELWYFTFSPGLFTHIAKGAELEATVEISQREVDGNTYTDRKVTQLYRDGQPIAVSQTPIKTYGRNLEAVKLELAAKARNTALMQACDLAKADKINIADILTEADRFYSWLENETKTPVEIKGPDQIQIKIPSIKIKTAQKTDTPAPKTEQLPIDLDWLKESLQTLQAKGSKSWSNRNVLGYLNTLTDTKSESPSEAVLKLNPEQAKKFIKEIEQALEGA